MIPRTYPSVTESNITKMVVYPLSSVTGLTAWVDYIPVKSLSSGVSNSYDGGIETSTLGSVSGLQAWRDYIPVFFNNSLTRAFSTDANGYIPVMSTSGDSAPQVISVGATSVELSGGQVSNSPVIMSVAATSVTFGA